MKQIFTTKQLGDTADDITQAHIKGKKNSDKNFLLEIWLGVGEPQEDSFVL